MSDIADSKFPSILQKTYAELIPQPTQKHGHPEGEEDKLQVHKFHKSRHYNKPVSAE